MKKLTHIFLLLFTTGIVASIYSSCSEESDCSMTGRPMMYCTFKTINPDDRTEILNDTLDSLTVRALGTDSILLNNEKRVHKIMMPLRYTSDSTVLIFQYDPVRHPNDVDTVYIIQQNTPYFQSMECGYMMKQNILRVQFGNRTNSSEKIDSLSLRNKEANANEIENLQIFFKYRDRTPNEELD